MSLRWPSVMIRLSVHETYTESDMPEPAQIRLESTTPVGETRHLYVGPAQSPPTPISSELIAPIFEITAETPFDRAKLVLRIDPMVLDSGDGNDLVFARWDSVRADFVLVANTDLIVGERRLVAEISRPGLYGVLRRSSVGQQRSPNTSLGSARTICSLASARLSPLCPKEPELFPLHPSCPDLSACLESGRHGANGGEIGTVHPAWMWDHSHPADHGVHTRCSPTIATLGRANGLGRSAWEAK